MKTEIFIENKRLDLTSDISSLLSFALDDIKDFASRNTMFSKTIILPGTANNNLLFGNIFDVKISNPYNSGSDNVATNFNASVSARFIMFNDHLQVGKGTMRLMEIVITDNVPEYEVAVFGELAGLVAELGSRKIEELDFSAYDQALTVANIEASWTATPGSGVFFPSNIDYGTYSDNKHDWDFKGIRPALYVKEYIDKIFAATGYTLRCDLFETERFKKLVIPHNQKTLQSLNTRVLAASRNNVADVINSGTAPVVELQWSSYVSSLFTDSLTISRFTYTGVPSVNLKLNLSIFGSYISNVIGFSMHIEKNGVTVPGTTMTLPIAGDTTIRYYTWTITDLDMSFATGDYIEAVYEASASFGTGSDKIKATSGNLFLDSDSAIATQVLYGNGIQMNFTIPKNILQKDFLSSIIKLFNLYLYEDRDYEKRIFIAPYVDYFDTNVSGV